MGGVLHVSYANESVASTAVAVKAPANVILYGSFTVKTDVTYYDLDQTQSSEQDFNVLGFRVVGGSFAVYPYRNLTERTNYERSKEKGFISSVVNNSLTFMVYDWNTRGASGVMSAESLQPRRVSFNLSEVKYNGLKQSDIQSLISELQFRCTHRHRYNYSFGPTDFYEGTGHNDRFFSYDAHDCALVNNGNISPSEIQLQPLR